MPTDEAFSVHAVACVLRNANQGLKNHIAAGGLKEVLEAFSQKPPLATWTAGLRSSRSTCSSANALALREIYDYAADHFVEWFPDSPSYQSYNRRLNRLNAVFAPLAQAALSQIELRLHSGRGCAHC